MLNIKHLDIIFQQVLLVNNYLLKGAVFLFFNIRKPGFKIPLLAFKDGLKNNYIFIKTFNIKNTIFKILYHFYTQNFFFIIILVKEGGK